MKKKTEIRFQISQETSNFVIVVRLIRSRSFRISEDGSEIELKHCASSKLDKRHVVTKIFRAY